LLEPNSSHRIRTVLLPGWRD